MEVHTKMKKAIKELIAYLAAGLTVWLCILIISNGNSVINGITRAIERCLNVIIPSLFAFMAISGIIINTKIYQYISKPFYPITKYILRMPNSLFFVFLLGNISGYPVGAKLLVELKKQNIIDKRTAEVMSCFCYGGGPAFFTGTIGLAVYGNTKVGLIIFLSVSAANFIIAIIMCRIFKLHCSETNEKIVFSSDNVIQAILSTGKSLFTICITILFFSVFMSLLDSEGIFSLVKQIGLSDNVCTLIKSFFEITNVSDLSPKSYKVIPFIAGICSFGGICVLMQVKAVVGKNYLMKLFIVTRFVAAILSTIICYLIMKSTIPVTLQAISDKTVFKLEADSFIPSLCLIVMIFTISFRKQITDHTKEKGCSHKNVKTAHS